MTATHKKINGVVYTPKEIVRRILDSVLPDGEDGLARVSLCDPACGDGAFLVPFAEKVLADLPKGKALAVLSRMTGFDLDRGALARCARRLDSLLRAKHPGAQADWRLTRADALQRQPLKGRAGRFTHVVGNPPYVRVQHLGESRRGLAKRHWKTVRGSTDLYIPFFELGLELLADGGKLGYITPSSWLRSNSASALREHLAGSHRVLKLLDFGEHQAFEGVTAYALITTVEKGAAPEPIPYWRHDGRKFRKAGTVRPSAGRAASPWVPATGPARSRLARLSARGPELGEIADIHVGIQTLADDVFIFPVVPPEGSGDLVMCMPGGERLLLERWMLRPILKASVLKDGRDRLSRMVIFPYDSCGKLLPGMFIRNNAPRTWEWLLRNKDRLLARDKGRFDPSVWHAWGRSSNILSGFGEKIITSPLSLRPNFQVCDDPGFTFYSGYCVKPRAGIGLEPLLEELNSSDMEFFINHTSRVYQGGWRSYAKSFIRRYPVPRSLAERQRGTS